MKKYLIVVLVALLGIAMFAACGGEKEETAGEKALREWREDQPKRDKLIRDAENLLGHSVTNPATTDTTTEPAAEGVLEINELTLTPAAGWKGEAMKESSMITLSTESGSAFTLLTVENIGSLALDVYVTAQKETLTSFGEIKEDKATYGNLEYIRLEYSIGGNPIYQLNGLSKNFFVMVTIHGGMTPEVESMLNSIVIKQNNSNEKETKSTNKNFKFKKGDVVYFNDYSGEIYHALYSIPPKYVDYKEILPESKCLVKNTSNRFRIINDGTAYKRATSASDDSYKPVWYMVEDIDGDCGVGYVFEVALELSE